MEHFLKEDRDWLRDYWERRAVKFTDKCPRCGVVGGHTLRCWRLQSFSEEEVSEMERRDNRSHTHWRN